MTSPSAPRSRAELPLAVALAWAGVLASHCARVGPEPERQTFSQRIAELPATAIAPANVAETGTSFALGSQTGPDYVKAEGSTSLPSGTTLPGPCVDPVLHAAFGLNADATVDNYRQLYISQTPWEDIDGDGTEDYLVKGGVLAASTYYLYVRRGDCGYYVGKVSDALMVGTDGKKRGDLVEIFTTGNVCPISKKRHYCRGIWLFGGTAYALSSEEPIDRPKPSIRQNPTVEDW